MCGGSLCRGMRPCLLWGCDGTEERVFWSRRLRAGEGGLGNRCQQEVVVRDVADKTFCLRTIVLQCDQSLLESSRGSGRKQCRRCMRQRIPWRGAGSGQLAAKIDKKCFTLESWGITHVDGNFVSFPILQRIQQTVG